MLNLNLALSSDVNLMLYILCTGASEVGGMGGIHPPQDLVRGGNPPYNCE